MRTYRTLLGLAILWHPALASEALDPSAISGVWRGTIAGSQVRVCFDPSGDDATYYYVRHLTGIPLFRQGKGVDRWVETSRDHPTGNWRLVSRSGNTMNGQWTDASGSPTALIQLERVQAATASTACGEQFEKPRITGTKVIAGDSSTIDGLTFRTLSALNGQIQVVELLGDQPAVNHMNAVRRNAFNEQVAAHFGCQDELDRRWGAESWGVSRQDAGYTYRVSISTVNANWVTFAIHNSGNCGGAHPFGDTSFVTYDLTTGRKLDLQDWLKGGRPGNALYSPPDRLRRTLIRKAIRQSQTNHPKDQQCIGLIKDYDDSFALSLRRNSIVFSTSFSYSVRACDEDIELPLSELRSFLTFKGSTAFQRIEDARSVPKPPTEGTP